VATSIHIGTSGWSYRDWKGIFYPEKLKSIEWLSFYAKTFRSVEIDSSFYHLPRKQTVEKWVDKVPDGFFFSAKMSRYLTHIKRLQQPHETLQHFFDVFEPMKHRMGPVLIQLPPSLLFDRSFTEQLYLLLKRKYSDYRFALEGRHPSWLKNESLELMAQYNIAFVIAQSGHGFPYGEHITAHDIYFRFHGPKELFASLYTTQALQQYAQLFQKWQTQNHTVWIFFNNDFHGYAIENALQLEEILKSNT
jgi:uncharacterized protein YecE (DUF72 family)